ncbi:MAG: hypothetical protein L0Y66_00830 [Myxococcaceae bacterium]|nr:hypothetical protein [Myxococcaceae bacterium]MCI0673727.1 hypothetical protein [Myxococcaceae bacterium]
MSTKNRFFPLALLAGLLAAPAALADRDHDRDDDDRRRDRRHRSEVHVHNHGCDHGPGPMPGARRGYGRYELQPVSVWVPGYREEVWVPEVCSYHPRRHRTRCEGGYYDRRWVDGHYEERQQWVWVSAPHPHHAPASYPVPPPPPASPGWSVRVGVHM